MNRITVVIAITVLLLGSLSAVTILSLQHEDVTAIVGFVMAGIIPTVTSLFAFKEAGQANDNAQQAVHNTNGILHAALGIDPSDTPPLPVADANGSTGKETAS